MACNKRMFDIEREINDFFTSNEFKKLALSYNGVYRDYCNGNKFQVFEDAAIDSICRAINVKIKEFIEKKDFYTGKVPKNAVKSAFFGTFRCLGGV